MDLVDQAVQVLIDGVDTGSTNMVALATTTAATTLWMRLREQYRSREAALEAPEQAVLASEPGDTVDIAELRRLLEHLSPTALHQGLTVHGDYVARDKNVYNYGHRK